MNKQMMEKQRQRWEDVKSVGGLAKTSSQSLFWPWEDKNLETYFGFFFFYFIIISFSLSVSLLFMLFFFTAHAIIGLIRRPQPYSWKINEVSITAPFCSCSPLMIYFILEIWRGSSQMNDIYRDLTKKITLYYYY